MNQTRILGATGELIETGKLQEYIEHELSELTSDIVVYNVLRCPKGDIQGDAREIKSQLERSYSQVGSVMLETQTDLDALPSTF